MLLTFVMNLGMAAGVVVPIPPQATVTLYDNVGGAKEDSDTIYDDRFLIEFLKTATDIINNQ